MEKIKIYGIQSQHVAKVRAVLLLKKLEFEHISVDLMNKSTEFEKLTPISKIPVLEDIDGTIIYDSQNISQYLDLKYPNSYELFSKDPISFSKILNVTAIANNIQETLPPMVLEKLGMLNEADKKEYRFNIKIYSKQNKKDVMAYIKTRLDKLNELLKEKKYFIDNRITFADISVLSLLPMLEFVGCDCSILKKYSQTLMKDKDLSKMFAPKEEKGIKEI